MVANSKSNGGELYCGGNTAPTIAPSHFKKIFTLLYFSYAWLACIVVIDPDNVLSYFLAPMMHPPLANLSN